VLRWFAAMASHMDSVQLEKFLSHVLIPVYRIVEDDTIRDPQMGRYRHLEVLGVCADGFYKTN
jgi:U3 small nucleolar RNA-associated protein 20